MKNKYNLPTCTIHSGASCWSAQFNKFPPMCGYMSAQQNTQATHKETNILVLRCLGNKGFPSRLCNILGNSLQGKFRSVGWLQKLVKSQEVIIWPSSRRTLCTATSSLSIQAYCRDQLPAMRCSSGARGNSRCKLTCPYARNPGEAILVLRTWSTGSCKQSKEHRNCIICEVGRDAVVSRFEPMRGRARRCGVAIRTNH